MVQILSTKLSKWVWHNQVPWYSFHCSYMSKVKQFSQQKSLDILCYYITNKKNLLSIQINNMVQILSTKSSKWVWHNQVPWSSFHCSYMSKVKQFSQQKSLDILCYYITNKKNLLHFGILQKCNCLIV